MAKILIIEDNETLAYGLRNNLEIEGHEIEVAGDGATGLTYAAESNPDLILLDLMLPDQDGFRVLSTLKQQGLSIPVLILTARGEERDKVRGLRLGAEDYVTKPFGLMELLARIEVVLRRGKSGDQGTPQPDVERFGSIEVCAAARRVFKEDKEISLAPKELDLMLTLMRFRGRVVSRIKLLEVVWGYPSAVVTRTVDTHVAELRRKLEDDPANPRHFLTVRKAGYRFEP